MSTSRFSHGVDEGFLEAVGLVSVHWGCLEILIDTIITRLVRISPDQSHALLTRLPFQTRLDILTALTAQVKQTRRRKRLEQLISNVRAIQQERNFIVHAVWVGGQKGNQGVVLRRKNLGSRREHRTAARVNEVADKIADAQLDVIGWMTSGRMRGPRISHSKP